MFLQETSLFLKATQQTSVAKPQVFPSQHCRGHLKMGTSHQLSIKAVLVKGHFWSCLTLQNKWKASTSVQQKIKLTQQLLLLIFMFLVRREQYFSKSLIIHQFTNQSGYANWATCVCLETPMKHWTEAFLLYFDEISNSRA